MPLTATLGFEADEHAADEVVLDVADALRTSGGALHGGAVMALADSAGGACAFLDLPDGAVDDTVRDELRGAVRESRVTRGTDTRYQVPRVGQMRSMMVPVPRPPPQHIEIRP